MGATRIRRRSSSGQEVHPWMPPWWRPTRGLCRDGAELRLLGGCFEAERTRGSSNGDVHGRSERLGFDC